MVRNRTNRVVLSQRDVRQTTQPDEVEPRSRAVVSTSQPSSTFSRHNCFTAYCTWCKVEGRHYACLTESPHVHCEECQLSTNTNTTPDWTGSIKHTESWVPASGPCCEDCLEATFEQGRNKAEVSRQGRELVDSVQCWCCNRGEELRDSVIHGWGRVRRWLECAKARWRSRNVREQAMSSAGKIQYEAEGFLEVKVLVSRQGTHQHLEIDFPTDVRIGILKQELAKLIAVPAEAQMWYHLNERVDETKTLDELHVDIGAIIEVKCQT